MKQKLDFRDFNLKRWKFLLDGYWPWWRCSGDKGRATGRRRAWWTTATWCKCRGTADGATSPVATICYFIFSFLKQKWIEFTWTMRSGRPGPFCVSDEKALACWTKKNDYANEPWIHRSHRVGTWYAATSHDVTPAISVAANSIKSNSTLEYATWNKCHLQQITSTGQLAQQRHPRRLVEFNQINYATGQKRLQMCHRRLNFFFHNTTSYISFAVRRAIIQMISLDEATGRWFAFRTLRGVGCNATLK